MCAGPREVRKLSQHGLQLPPPGAAAEAPHCGLQKGDGRGGSTGWSIFSAGPYRKFAPNRRAAAAVNRCWGTLLWPAGREGLNIQDKLWQTPATGTAHPEQRRSAEAPGRRAEPRPGGCAARSRGAAAEPLHCLAPPFCAASRAPPAASAVVRERVHARWRELVSELSCRPAATQSCLLQEEWPLQA